MVSGLMACLKPLFVRVADCSLFLNIRWGVCQKECISKHVTVGETPFRL
jgi:hypothetical protein